MSSFKRKASSTAQKLPAGCRKSPSLSTLLLTSSGIPSLDDILGGGIQLGTDLLVLNPDPHSAHSELVQKYFIAQGLANEQDVYVFDLNGQNLMESCMWTSGLHRAGEESREEDGSRDGEGKVKIAWRYEGMQKFKTTVASQSSDQEDYCRPFDLTVRVPPAIVDSARAAGRLRIEGETFDETGDPYDLVIRRIEGMVKPTGVAVTSVQNVRTTIRLSIPSFANPLWGDPTPEKIVRFLFRLRLILRRFPSTCALLTMPSHLSASSWGGTGWIDKLGWSSDACITMGSSAGDPSMAALFPSHHGLLKIHKLPCVHTLVPASDRFSTLRGLSTPSSSVSSGGVGENNLAFKCTRKRLVFETFHLDVEGGVGERRTTPSASVSSFVNQGGADSETHTQQKHSHDARDHGAVAAVEVKLDEETSVRVPPAGSPVVAAGVPKGAAQKKPKKRVGFQVDRPDLYDF